MRTTRLLFLTGTILPALLLTAPALARSRQGDERAPLGTASIGLRLAQADEEPRGPRGGGGPRGGPGGAEHGPGPGGPRGGAERPEPRQAPPAARERPEPHQAPPAARERPEPRATPQAPAAPPTARERPEPRQAPSQQREAPAERAAPPVRQRSHDDDTPPARPTPPPREERAPPRAAPERPAVPAQPARPTPPSSEEPARPAPTRPTPPATQAPAEPRAAPGQRHAPDMPVPPTAAPPAAPQPGRPAAPQPPASTDHREPGAQRPAPQPGPPQGMPPAPPPGAAPAPPPGARPVPNQAPGLPGHPFTPPGQTPPDAVQPGLGAPGQSVPGQGVPGQLPPAQPGQPQPGQPGQVRPDRVPPGPQPGQTLVPGQVAPGQPAPPPGQQPGAGYDRRGPDGARDDSGRRDVFNTPGRPGYVPGGFRGADEDVRDYEQVRRDRREYDVDGRTYYREPGRIIVRDRDGYFIRHDETERFRELDPRGYRSERRGGEIYSTIDRPGGEQIVTVVDDDGRLLRRYRRFRDGREVVIIDNRYGPGGPRPIYDDVIDLPPPDIRIPRERYVVDYERADPRMVYGALTAPPVMAIERRYTLDQVRYSPQLRARMPSVDINTITFDSGSFTVSPDQARQLQTIADAINQAIRANPQEVFLIEGYTDAVGSDVDNLSLSDRRAQSVATVLTQQFQVPPENLTTQGYGEQYLKVNTQGASRENRRVTVRRITPLLQQQATEQGQPPR